ncbi:MAG: hypothetical protein RL258_1344 [Pseudomonadota bacterium]
MASVLANTQAPYSPAYFSPSERAVLTLGLGLGALAQSHGVRLGLAESCTGGLASAWVTAVSGSSQWFEGGVVSYSNALKTALLGVPSDALAHHGAVSLAVAQAMAQGLSSRFAEAHAGHSPCRWATAAITGIAGPGGGSETKPVGLVCFAWHMPDNTLSHEACRFLGDRQAVQRQAAWWALEGLFTRLSGFSRPSPMHHPVAF